MGVYSGDFGVVAGVSTCERWSISEEEDSNTYKASNTRGATGRTKGIRRWNGSYEAKGGVPVLMPRQVIAFVGQTSPDDGIEGNNGTLVSGTGLVQQATIEWNWETGEGIKHSVEFVSNGANLVQTVNQTAIVDSSVPAIDDVCPTKVEYDTAGGADDWNDITNLTTGSLVFTAANKPYANSNTNCVEAHSLSGIDVTLNLNRQDHQNLLTLGGEYQLRIYTSATLFWLLRFMRFINRDNKVIDVETGDIISYTMSFGFTSHAGTPLVLGSIINPNSVQYWPFT